MLVRKTLPENSVFSINMTISKLKRIPRYKMLTTLVIPYFLLRSWEISPDMGETSRH